MAGENMREILSVSALNDRIKALLEEGFALVWVEGEVSNLRRPASGHIYFTLKDAKSQIRAVIFRNPFAQRGWGRSTVFALEEGMCVVCRARLTVYPPRGDYQLTVDDLPERIRAYKSSQVLLVSDNPSEFVTMEEVERRYILRVLEAVGGNKTMAAEILGLDRKTLYRKLDRYLPRPPP